MIHKSYAAMPAASSDAASRPAGKVLVTFELPSCTWACRIFVCGDFNDWSQSATPMRQDGDGIWRATVPLEPNRRYCFRYLIDGNWQTDDHADGWIESGYGGENSVVDTGILADKETTPYLAPLSPNIVEANRLPESMLAPAPHENHMPAPTSAHARPTRIGRTVTSSPFPTPPRS